MSSPSERVEKLRLFFAYLQKPYVKLLMFLFSPLFLSALTLSIFLSFPFLLDQLEFSVLCFTLLATKDRNVFVFFVLYFSRIIFSRIGFWNASLSILYSASISFLSLRFSLFSSIFLSSWLITLSEFWVQSSLDTARLAEERMYQVNGAKNVVFEYCEHSGISYLVHERNSTPKPVLVLTHGFGTGRGCFASILPLLGRHFRVYSIDWLGMGMSRKDPLKTPTLHSTHDYYLDSFEAWRGHIGLDRFYLLGHSFGGYLCALYTIRNPSRVLKLILASPMGVPVSSRRIGMERGSRLVRALRFLWDRGVTPQKLLRVCGPFGPALIQRFVDIRFRTASVQHMREYIAQYAYHTNTIVDGSFESITQLLDVYRWSRLPFEDVLGGIKSPVLFLYGAMDWMDEETGRRAVEKLHREGIDAAIIVIPEVGHQLIIDDPGSVAGEILKNVFPNSDLCL